jgi:hypothetical protein
MKPYSNDLSGLEAVAYYAQEIGNCLCHGVENAAPDAFPAHSQPYQPLQQKKTEQQHVTELWVGECRDRRRERQPRTSDG